MDRNNLDSSAFSVPGSLQDLTLLSTPLPKATSTAFKRRSFALDKDTELLTWETVCPLEVDFQAKFNLSPDRYLDISSDPKRLSTLSCNMNENPRKMENINGEHKNTSNSKENSAKEVVEPRLFRGNTCITITGNSGVPKYHCPITESVSQYGRSTENTGNNSNGFIEPISNICDNKDFKFAVPQVPIRLEKPAHKGRLELHHLRSIANKNEDSLMGNDYLRDLPVRLPRSVSSYDGDRSSIASSTSSLGIISSETLEGEKDKPLMEISEAEKLDLNLRLAKTLNLDTSQLKDGELDISDIICNRTKESICSVQREENKENISISSGSDSGRLYGYASDSSAHSRNTTAKELFLNSKDISANEDQQAKHNSSKTPLTENNFASSKTSFVRNSTGRSHLRLSYQQSEGRKSIVNPFGDFGKVSVASEDFQFADNAEDRLKKDEEVWQGPFIDGRHSMLSGIYSDCDVSIRSQGERLSITSFLRSKSGPLGCLEKGTENSPRPTFGHPVNSPEKKSKARPLASPPENKLTFVAEDDGPTKDAEEPWHPKSLLEQHSLIHSRLGDEEDSEVSVPSLSCIGQILAETDSKMSAKDIMNKLLEAGSRKKSDPKDVSKRNTSFLSPYCAPEHFKSLSAVVTGVEANNSFVSLCDEDIRHNLTSHTYSVDDSCSRSVCNVTDFEGDGEEYVTVLTPESMKFDIFNELPREQRYHIAHTCYLNNQKSKTAALVHVTEDSLLLKPRESREVKVVVVALVEGSIKVKLEIVRTDPKMKGAAETNTVFGKLTAEIPKISVLGPRVVEMKPTATIGMYKGDFILKNSGLSVVTLKLVATHVSSKEPSGNFSFDGGKGKMVRCSLAPGTTLNQELYCQSPPLVEVSKKETARVEVYLDTPLPAGVKEIEAVTFRAELRHNFFNAPSVLYLSGNELTRCEVINNGPTTHTIETAVDEGYFVQPKTFTILPNQSFVFHAGYQHGLYTSGMLILKTSDPEMIHPISLSLQPTLANYNLVHGGNNLGTPQSSRAASPTSPCSNISSLGELRLACTHKELVWGGCALQQRVVRSCTIKNLNNQREKLNLKITDQQKCFKIVSENSSMVSEVKLCLQPLESRQLSVAMCAGSAGAKWGHLTIARISCPNNKKLLFLYAFGGKAKVHIEGVLQDPEQHMWLYLDPTALSSSFSLTNIGDNTAFIKISEGVTATTVGGGISISPPEQILQPGQSVSIEISLSVTLERLEYLLAQPSQNAVCITRLTVIHGDESTRARLNRLSRLDPKLTAKLSQLSQLLPPSHIQNLDKLGEDCSCAETLWLEDVSEWTIGVLVKRSVLESLKLDTSYEYVDLATTVIH